MALKRKTRFAIVDVMSEVDVITYTVIRRKENNTFFYYMLIDDEFVQKYPHYYQSQDWIYARIQEGDMYHEQWDSEQVLSETGVEFKERYDIPF